MQSSINHEYFVEVPWRSSNFELRFNELDKCQTLFYKVAQKCQPTDSACGSVIVHYEDVDLPRGEWQIEEILEDSVRLSRIT